MTSKSGQAAQQILDAAEDLICRKGATAVTIEAVAKAAGTAKGLVNYHYKTKRDLLLAVATHLAARRRDRWKEAFMAEDPLDAVDRTWRLLTEESENGTIRAWSSLTGADSTLTDQTAKTLLEEFGHTLSGELAKMLTASGMNLRIPEDEVGWFLAAVVHGMAAHLVGGVSADALEGAYQAAWLGVLSLAEPRS